MLFKSLFLSFWILLKPALFFIVPLVVAFCVSFYVAYLKKKKSGTAVRDVIAHKNTYSEPSLFTKLFIDLPKQYWENYYNRAIGEFPQHGIIMYTGKQGNGKTLSMTRDILKLQYEYPSLKVGTNYGLSSEDFVLDDWRKLVYQNNGKLGVLCAIDECQNWFSSSMSRNFPPRMLATVTQNRKNVRLIMMTSHYFTNVAKPIRLHCTEERACKTYLKCFTVVTRYFNKMDAEGNLIDRQKLGRYCFVHTPELYKAYDTYKVIENLSESGFVNDEWNGCLEVSDTDVQPIKKARGKRKRNVEVEVMNAIDSVNAAFDFGSNIDI